MIQEPVPAGTSSPNLADLLFRSARRFPQKAALIDRAAGELSYEQLARQVASLASGLRNLGVRRGDRVGLLMYNSTAWVTGYFAVLALGAVVIPLNTRLTAAELSVILNDAEAAWLVSNGADFGTVLGQLTVSCLKGVVLEEPGLPGAVGMAALLADSGDVPDLPVPVAADELACLVYTSGTTGVPKGVMLSHGNIAADAAANIQVIEAVPDDRFITISPLFHVFGQTNIMVSALAAGAGIVLVRKFSPRQVLESIERHRVTFMAAVPTMYQMMLTHLREKPYNLSSLRVCHSGAAPMAQETFHEVEKYFGAPVQEGYGLSEASSIVCSNPMRGPRKPGSVGLPLPGVTVEIFGIDEERPGEPLPPGEIGELHVRGPIVMQGYYKRPEETAKVLVGGWLKSRDLAYRDEDGYIHIVDRRDDLINIGGVKVYPREIEEVLYRHPAVQAVAVTGIPSTLYQHAIKAFVVLRPGHDGSREELQQFCKPVLAEYKIPKFFEFVDEIPQGATGKILRKELRRRASEQD